jgi:hypothetical protein
LKNTMSLHDFDDLLRAAALQPLPQRLLFVFAAAELPDAATAEQRRAQAAGQGGALAPLMCVDKPLADITSFAALVAEAAQFGQTWQLVFAAATDDSGSAAADVLLQRMVEDIRVGRLGAYLPFDRSGQAVALRAA